MNGTPFIDYTFCRDRTQADPAHTGLLGFALGGLLALHLAQQHHHVFGKFACLSTSFQDLSEDTPNECLIIEQIRQDRKFKPDRILYFDYGTLDPDAQIEAYQQELNKVLLAKVSSGIPISKSFARKVPSILSPPGAPA